MLPAALVVRADLTGGCLHGCLAAAGGQVASGGRGLSVATLVSWLLAESLGAYMLRSWLASGGARRSPAAPRQETMSPALILGHAGLAFAGLVSWVSFLMSSLPALAWLAVGLLAPAIGLGIATVTVWTPYPGRRPDPDHLASQDRAPTNSGTPAILVTNEMLDRVLANEALTSELVDDLVQRMLAEPPEPRPVSRGWRFAPVIPILHGVLALATFLLAVLAAIATGI
jgi:hypothetical protein